MLPCNSRVQSLRHVCRVYWVGYCGVAIPRRLVGPSPILGCRVIYVSVLIVCPAKSITLDVGQIEVSSVASVNKRTVYVVTTIISLST